MDFNTVNDEYTRLRKELEQLQGQLTKTAMNVVIAENTEYPLSIPVALRKTTTTHMNRENREKQRNEETLQTLRNYFREHNMISERFDPTPYEIPHSESFTDMLSYE